MLHLRRLASLLPLVLVAGAPACSSSGPSAQQDAGHEDAGRCGTDCTKVATQPCTTAVCNTGQVSGPVGVCVVVPVTGGSCGSDASTHRDAASGDAARPGDAAGGDASRPGEGGAPGDGAAVDASNPGDAAGGDASRPGDGAAVDASNPGDAAGGDASPPGDAATDAGPCGTDCSKIVTSPCTVSVCNTGQALGPIDTCVVVEATDGTTCDDGDLCTTGDACKAGVCSGVAVDCSTSPLAECNSVACDTTTGQCAGTPDTSKNGDSCVESGDPCQTGKTCSGGLCSGGAPTDCSSLTDQCAVGVCDSTSGACTTTPAASGTACTEGVRDDCHVGSCDAAGVCRVTDSSDGTSCNDHDACTQGDVCASGVCTGAPVAGCSFYFQEGFEVCPHGWALSGDWQCGTPTSVGPSTAHTGDGVLATQLAGDYSNNDSPGLNTAESPTIDLTMATAPMLSFWAWEQTQADADGWLLYVSSDAGQVFLSATTVAPAYETVVDSAPMWGGDHAAQGWRNFTADLTAYAGQQVILGFFFQSDATITYPGVYLDDMVVAEPEEIPLSIATASPLPDLWEGMPLSTPISRTGGTSGAAWSILAGGVNASWLSIDPSTGVLSGVPTLADVGAVRFTVHVEQPSLPSNCDDATFTFNVVHDLYFTSFEGSCPDGWTLTGDWQCGSPSNEGPSTAYDGAQCLGTNLAGDYSDDDTFASTVAVSPPVDLTGVTSATLSFYMWIDTEGGAYDGANLQVSDDGGVSWSVVTAVAPTYPLTVGGEPAWGGHEADLGWQLVTADLSSWAGHSVQVRFAFQSDASGAAPGVYIDDVLVR